MNYTQNGDQQNNLNAKEDLFGVIQDFFLNFVQFIILKINYSLKNRKYIHINISN